LIYCIAYDAGNKKEVYLDILRKINAAHTSSDKNNKISRWFEERGFRLNVNKCIQSTNI